MAKYCDKECEELGGICDFCIHYQDENEGTDKGFAGEGKCLMKNEVVVAHDGCDDDFYCFRLENK
ncbi:hypothetical protein [Lysinibacillus sp. FSL K6-0102]|uniref:hypothetical protein n=1 Tax=Lysinibacillus sp. FSL K6-0102 TaxID=2975290 RepID=UPI0030F946BA